MFDNKYRAHFNRYEFTLISCSFMYPVIRLKLPEEWIRLCDFDYQLHVVRCKK